jgi:diadenosine tetraphosphatase ApaH/serine/threonine PP2A family protein phosphatase
MKTAFICCIHSNLPALEAVGNDIASQNIARVFCLGDVIGYAAQPHECVQYVRERNWPVLLGNHEEALLRPDMGESFTPVAKKCLHYSLGALSKSDRAWLKTLPEMIEEPDFQLVHGSPDKPMTQSYVLTTDLATKAFAAATRTWVFHGHTHVPMVFFKTDPISYSKDPILKLDRNTPALINVGSVGQPRDKDPRACYAIFDSDTLQVEYRRVQYDVAKAAGEVRAALLPDKIADRLALGA